MCSPASTSPAQTRKPAPPVTGPVRGGRAHRRSATQRTHRPARRTNEPWAANQREGRARTARDRVKPRCAVRPLPSQLCTQRPTIPNESNEPRENNPTHRAVRGICGGPALERLVYGKNAPSEASPPPQAYLAADRCMVTTSRVSATATAAADRSVSACTHGRTLRPCTLLGAEGER